MQENYRDINEYLVRISKRIAGLEVNSQEIQDDVVQQSKEIRETKEGLDSESAALRNEIVQVRHELIDLSGEVTLMLESFKRLARKEAFDRLDRKINAWGPEKLATHDDLDRGLKKYTEAYCVKCREKTKMFNPEHVVFKNNRQALKGTCRVCGSVMFKLIKNS